MTGTQDNAATGGAKRERVLVALSGGVDSAVAAGLLLEQGYDLVGVTLHLWDASGESQVGRCCSPEDRDDARRVADHLGIPHYVIDEREAFRKNVVDPFLDDYIAGKTPSPCVHCNRTVKLDHLTRIADDFGAAFIATGHYARIERDPSRGPDSIRLRRGLDHDKDQSYFLFGVPPRTLGRLMCPLGGFRKDAVRAEAERLGLPNARKPDSQELCFVPDGNIRGFVERQRGALPAGKILDSSGATLGTHTGIAGFTVGQRRGLDLGGGPPRYVLKIVPESQDVIVGGDAALAQDRLEARDVRWIGPVPTEAFEALVRIRYRHEAAPARVVPTPGGFIATFHEAQRAVTPGQATVVYTGDEVLGGGFIQA